MLRKTKTFHKDSVKERSYASGYEESKLSLKDYTRNQ